MPRSPTPWPTPGSGRTVVVVTSGGPIAVVAATLVDPDADARPRLGALWARFNTVTVNAAVTRVVVGSTGARLLAFNEHAHLAPEPADLPLSRSSPQTVSLDGK